MCQWCMVMAYHEQGDLRKAMRDQEVICFWWLTDDKLVCGQNGRPWCRQSQQKCRIKKRLSNGNLMVEFRGPPQKELPVADLEMVYTTTAYLGG